MVDLDVVDMDGDSDLDLLFVHASMNDAFWLANENGEFKQPTVLPTEILRPTNVAAADIDGDDDTDVVVSAQYGIENRYQLLWFENDDETATAFEPVHLIMEESGRGPLSELLS